jgi:CRISPR-associated protein Csb3
MMIPEREPEIRLRVDPTNPGQFFACCGLLELANQLWGESAGFFNEESKLFFIKAPDMVKNVNITKLIEAIVKCHITNAMNDDELNRLENLSKMPRKEILKLPLLEAEKRQLEEIWRAAPILFHEPFDLRVDWFLDDRSGGNAFKTWAGQQSVLDIASNMKRLVQECDFSRISHEDLLFWTKNSDSVPFNFDSNLGGVGSDLDVGFSFDPLKIHVQIRPIIEILAFIGLQRFRPVFDEAKNCYRYSIWFTPLIPEIASVAACGLLGLRNSKLFEFRLLYRTKYLKSFLPARQV